MSIPLVINEDPMTAISEILLIQYSKSSSSNQYSYFKRKVIEVHIEEQGFRHGGIRIKSGKRGIPSKGKV